MKYTIIEDCSPYYIRFTHDGIDEFLDYTKQHIPPNISNFPKWVAYNVAKYSRSIGESIVSKTPISKILNLKTNRVNFFISGPGLYYRAHKDGFPGDRYSINYPVLVQDDKCVTSWYSDEDCKNYRIDNLSSRNSRECIGFDKTKHTPLKTMTARPGECVLFNTEIYHDWDNTASNNRRIILTLRDVNSENIYFEDARKALFGY
jgi:hypothetical protein